MVNAVRSRTESDRQHVVEGAAAGVWLWVYWKLATLTVRIQIVYEYRGLIVEDVRVSVNGSLVEPNLCQPTVGPPICSVVRTDSF
jgi:hypothetical protein